MASEYCDDTLDSGSNRLLERPCVAPESRRADERLLPLSLLSLDLRLSTADGAPLLVLGHGHAAFHADAHALPGRG
jgi:hypothetical protein